ncbi:MAG TPA: MOSC domain-containing protein [Ktedonobacteraceae bacterium]
MQIATLQTIQTGKPQQLTVPPNMGNSAGLPWETSFFRTPVSQPLWLYKTHLADNEQADKKNHGQLDQAVLLYAASHYPLWRSEFDLPMIGPGGFGENFTLEGISEETACLGDIYALGDTRIQVTGPRYPCTKIERRWATPGLTARVAETGRTGWYCQVLQEGSVEPGLPLQLIERPYPTWTIALINDLGHGRKHDPAQAQAIAACPILVNELWQNLLTRTVENV